MLHVLILQQAPVSVMPVRWLNLQEYQSKKLMQDNGITVQQFRVASNKEEARNITKDFSK